LKLSCGQQYKARKNPYFYIMDYVEKINSELKPKLDSELNKTVI